MWFLLRPTITVTHKGNLFTIVLAVFENHIILIPQYLLYKGVTLHFTKFGKDETLFITKKIPRLPIWRKHSKVRKTHN